MLCKIDVLSNMTDRKILECLVTISCKTNYRFNRIVFDLLDLRFD